MPQLAVNVQTAGGPQEPEYVVLVDSITGLAITSFGGAGGGLSESLWTDNTGAYFVRVDTASVITWTNLSGGASSAPGTGARPAAGTSIVADKTVYTATAAATGYSIGDVLNKYAILEPFGGTVVTAFWVNATTGVKLASAPSSANIALSGAGAGLTDTQMRATPIPVSGTVTANAGTNLNTSALSLDATVAAQSAKLPATLGAKTGANSLSVVPASDASFAVTGPQTDTQARATPQPVTKSQQTVTPCVFTFATSTTVSAAADLGVARLVGLSIPASFEGTSLAVWANDDALGFKPVYDKAGVALSFVVGPARRVVVSPADYLGIRNIQFVSNVAIAANRTLQLILEQ